jgi:hypothetical protein
MSTATDANLRKLIPMSKTSVAATMVKRDKTRIYEISPQRTRPRETAKPQDRKEYKAAIGDQIYREQRVGPFAMALKEQCV